MMHVARLTISNFKRYRGEHVLRLEPKAYAILASDAEDPERSNWIGKSTLARTILFALYGDHGERTEDAWISRGEKSAFVELEMSNGDVVRRERTIGKSTKLTFTRSKVDAKGDEAQAAIESMLRLSASDFLSTCFFEQKQMSKIVTQKPRERTAIVAGWLGLEKLQRASEIATEEAVSESEKERSLVVVANSRMGADQDATQSCTAEAEAALALEIKRIEGELAAASARRSELQQQASLQARARQFVEIADRGRETLAALNAVLTNFTPGDVEKSREHLAQIRDEHLALIAEEKRLNELARGRFDGICPVTCDTCPIKDEINEQSAPALVALGYAQKETREHAPKLESARAAAQAAEAKSQEVARLRDRVEMLKQQANSLRPDYERSKNQDGDVGQLLERAFAAETALSGDLARLRERMDQVYARRRARAAQVALAESEMAKAREHAARALTARQAAAVLGRNGAQKRIAELALSEIEEGANALLSASGIALSVRVAWGREGEGIAKVCAECGSPFPSSVKVKVCERCGAARGANLIDKLEIELSDVSGAAEDIAGVAIQLSASRWLRERKGSEWECAVLDEPFGALDAANRRALSLHLAALLGSRYGARQAFVIAHQSGVLDAMPGRILVEGDGKWSKVRVIA